VLPWSNVDQVVFVSNQEVVIDAADLDVRGVRGGEYDVVDMDHERATSWPFDHIVTFTLDRPVDRDRLLLTLDTSAPNGVHTDWGERGKVFLDGKWDFIPNGDAPYHAILNVLPGAAKQYMLVGTSDAMEVRRRMGTSTTEPAPAPASDPYGRYAPTADLNGDGRINAVDLKIVRSRQGTHLPFARAEDLAYGIRAASRGESVTRSVLARRRGAYE
jgi:hypothetical protein